MKDEHRAAVEPAAIEGSEVLRAGRADVFRIRDRTRRRRLLRLVTILALIDAYLWYRFATHRAFSMPTLPGDAIIWLPLMLMVLAIIALAFLPFFNGRSPHLIVRPEQIEVGLSDVQGLRTQVDEVRRTLDVFLGYATFRDELGGNPRRGVLFEGRCTEPNHPGTTAPALVRGSEDVAGVRR